MNANACISTQHLSHLLSPIIVSFVAYYRLNPHTYTYTCSKTEVENNKTTTTTMRSKKYCYGKSGCLYITTARHRCSIFIFSSQHNRKVFHLTLTYASLLIFVLTTISQSFHFFFLSPTLASTLAMCYFLLLCRICFYLKMMSIYFI